MRGIRKIPADAAARREHRNRTAHALLAQARIAAEPRDVEHRLEGEQRRDELGVGEHLVGRERREQRALARVAPPRFSSEAKGEPGARQLDHDH